MAEITASEVAKLRKKTGAGMMDCKNALTEANGDFDKASEIIRKKGQAIANKRADREATEGVVLAKVSQDNKTGAMIVLNCETDFVAKNDEFTGFANIILNTAVENKPAELQELKNLTMDGKSIEECVVNQSAVTGEKVVLSFYEKISAEYVLSYIHPGNKLASVVGFNKPDIDIQVAKDIAMQVAAMNPVAVDKDEVPKDVIEKEIEIGKEQARQEGKPENLLEKIAMGKLNKFYNESTLLNQEFIKDSKKKVRQYLAEVDKELVVTGFLRYSLTD